MMLHRNITKFIAVLFLLMLGQKTGVGIFLHNVLHTSEHKISSGTTPDTSTINFACNCIDDFSSPFDETVTVSLNSPIIHKAALISFSRQSAPSAFYLFSSLRGPPVSFT